MRNLKKFLALVLAMMMTLSLMVTANATNVEFGDGETITDAFFEDITVLAGMGVIKGVTTEEFQPTAPVTRAEMAAILYRIVTDDAEGTSDALHAEYGSFKDVASDKWYAGYVGYCANAGLIIGYGDGTFRPSNKVTGYEALVMVLRAMGYDQPGEFSKSDWRTHAASIATQRGLLTKINSTRYKGTLSQPALREVVAEIAFQAINVPMVEWTAAFGYQTTHYSADVASGEQRVENDTLGELWYGLTDGGTVDAPRVILGNQATGESCTLLGNTTVAYTSTDATGAQTKYVDVSYAYPGSLIDKGDVEPASAKDIPVGNGIRLAEKTGLDMFGHKVTAWYDGRPGGNKPTYAMFDRATHTATVQALDDSDPAAADPNLSNADPTDAFLGMAAQKAGFSVDLENSKAWFSDRYSRIMGGTAGGFGDKPAAGKGSLKAAVAPTNANSIYSLISNNDGKTVDVVVSLQGEVGVIAQKNTTATKKTLTVGDLKADLSGAGDKSTFVGTAAGIFAINSLTENSTQTLGDNVVVWQIVGTNKKDANAPDYSAWAPITGNAGTYSNDNAGAGGVNYRYELEKLEKTVTATIRTYSTKSNEITTTEGDTYKPSWFRVLTNGAQATDKVIGADNTVEPFQLPTTYEVGKTYTIALDNFGNWLGLVPARDDFLYITYADYEVGGLGDGSIKYAVTGVNWDGEKVVNHEMTRLFGLDTNEYPTPGTSTLATGYNDDAAFDVNRKFLGDGTGFGNQQKEGKYYGSVVSDSGVVTVDQAKLGGYANTTTGAAADWTISATDVANGFADLAGDGSTLATPNTKFIVVSGTGTATLDVKVYEGMSEFLRGSSWVSINLTSTPKGNTYYITEADRYNKWNTSTGTGRNDQVAAVIMDLRDVSWSNATDLYYAAPDAAATGAKLAGSDTANVNQYELWHNGEKGYYFVNTDPTVVGANLFSPTAGVAATGTATTGDFYTLIQIDTINGVPVYKAVKAIASPTDYDQAALNNLAGDGVCNTDQAYAYIGTSNINTASIGGEIYNVSNAKVVDLAHTPASTWDEITSVADINAAISGGYTGIKVAIVNEGVNVSVIYVTAVA